VLYVNTDENLFHFSRKKDQSGILNQRSHQKKREVAFIVASRLENQPFKNREHVLAEIRRCASFGDVCQYLSFTFVALGVIGDALSIKLGLEPMFWSMLAIVAGLNATIGHTHTVVAKHLPGIEAESKKQERISKR
jgi:hypothetical protein